MATRKVVKRGSWRKFMSAYKTHFGSNFILFAIFDVILSSYVIGRKIFHVNDVYITYRILSITMPLEAEVIFS